MACLMGIAFLLLLFMMPSRNPNAALKKAAPPAQKTSILDPFRALKYPALLILGIAALLYNFGFFTLLAYSPFVMHLDEHGLGFVFPLTNVSVDSWNNSILLKRILLELFVYWESIPKGFTQCRSSHCVRFSIQKLPRIITAVIYN